MKTSTAIVKNRSVSCKFGEKASMIPFFLAVLVVSQWNSAAAFQPQQHQRQQQRLANERSESLQLQLTSDNKESVTPVNPSRRSFLSRTATIGTACATAASSFLLVPPTPAYAASGAGDLKFVQSPSGLEWADAKVGSGAVKQTGEIAAVDYVMSTSGARYGAKIYSTADKNAPYRWTLGDGSTIAGLEQAVVGGDGIEPMRPGGIRRVIIPGNLAYASLGKQGNADECQVGKGVGPIPPTGDAFEEYQRFKNIYCNPNRPYQPDLVMDIKLYGKRAN
eukprot:CAMPEP_0198125614 /NCGR_PEP_ID=MMETSP1442-20131203/42970_1 /TAXON_ID= /ORGANISM="Craspedostauros australis, Strain CCMP3328" /LENGTH=277 /DNA_ID=CAMNT_0043785241 /DNA_START=80 /DNA_END=913 /DNA_ORIENTATION=-